MFLVASLVYIPLKFHVLVSPQQQTTHNLIIVATPFLEECEGDIHSQNGDLEVL